MDHAVAVRLVEVSCEVVDSNPLQRLIFNVGTDWPVSHLRHEVQIAMGADCPTEFKFFVSKPGQYDMKVNQRREKRLIVADILSPKVLKLKACD